MEKKKTFTLAVLTIIIAMSMATSSVKAVDWVEVVRFTGGGTTDYFTCDHVEWRITWEYTPDKNYPSLAVFNVVTYREGADVMFIDYIFKTGDSDTSGVSYIHNKDGTFYMKINVANAESYTIIVEQDLNSIPEFTPVALIIGLMTVSASAVVLSKKRRR